MFWHLYLFDCLKATLSGFSLAPNPTDFIEHFFTSQYFWKSGAFILYKGNTEENAMNKQLPNCSGNCIIITIKSLLTNARLILRVFGSLVICEKLRGTKTALNPGLLLKQPAFSCIQFSLRNFSEAVCLVSGRQRDKEEEEKEDERLEERPKMQLQI